MNDTNKPRLEELPSPRSLLRSTIIACIGAVAILVTIVLPAEYAIDPTGAGRVLGLTQMGEIKRELAEEAERDRKIHGGDQSSNVLDSILGLFVGAAQAQESWRDKVTFALGPGETHEVKLIMKEGEVAEYRMMVEGGRINFDLHAHGEGRSITYERGRGSKGAEGRINAAFAGEHGWFLRNRDRINVNVTLQLRGAYSRITQSK